MRATLPSLTYIVINDEAAAPGHGEPRYSRDDLRTCLVFAGWKPRVAVRAVERSFLLLQERVGLSPADPASLAPAVHEMCPGVWAVRLRREIMEELLLRCMPQKVAVTPEQRLDLQTAMSLVERRTGVVILLCGTSGTGKSTLASLLASRLGIGPVLSTDSVRAARRAFFPDDPVLAASSYTVGAVLARGDQAVVLRSSEDADAGQQGAEMVPEVGRHGGDSEGAHASDAVTSPLPTDDAVLQGYEAQCEAVLGGLESAIVGCAAKSRSLVVEGVHLRPRWAAALAAATGPRGPLVLPFLVAISNEAKHTERFAVRARAMTLRPEGNRYVRHLRAIRTIQASLLANAAAAGVPVINNTNVDRSLAVIHATVLACARLAASPAVGGGDGTPGGDGASRTNPPVPCSSWRPVVPGPDCTPLLRVFQRARAASWSGTAALQDIRSTRDTVATPDDPGLPPGTCQGPDPSDDCCTGPLTMSLAGEEALNTCTSGTKQWLPLHCKQPSWELSWPWSEGVATAPPSSPGVASSVGGGWGAGSVVDDDDPEGSEADEYTAAGPLVQALLV